MRKNFIKTVGVSVLAAALFFGVTGCSKIREPEGGTEKEEPAEEAVNEINDLSDESYVNLYGRLYYNGDMEGMAFVNAASGFEVRFWGTTLTMSAQSTYINGWESVMSVFLDGETDSNAEIVTVKSSMLGTYLTVTLAEGLDEGEHTVKVLKRLPSNKDTVLVSSLATDGRFLSAPEKPSLKIEFFGDSITCGYGALRDVSQGDNNNNTAETTNAMQSYAGVAAQLLGADWRIYGRDGIAMQYSYSGVQYSVLNNPAAVAVDLDPARYPYDYNSYLPDVVVIYLGTNDYFAQGVHADYSSDGLKIAFVQFIRNVVGYYYGTDVPVVLCSGLMARGSGLDEVMKGVKEMLPEYNIRTVEFEPCASNHPVVAEHEAAGEQLAQTIETMLDLRR